MRETETEARKVTMRGEGKAYRFHLREVLNASDAGEWLVNPIRQSPPKVVDGAMVRQLCRSQNASAEGNDRASEKGGVMTVKGREGATRIVRIGEGLPVAAAE